MKVRVLKGQMGLHTGDVVDVIDMGKIYIVKGIFDICVGIPKMDCEIIGEGNE